MTTHLIVADDHPLFRSAIAHLLSRLSQEIKVTEVENFSDLNIAIARSNPLPSLILLDLKLPDTQGIDGLLSLKKKFPSLPIVIVSAYDDSEVIRGAMRYGASGFIPKSLDMDEMAKAFKQVLDGDAWFPSIPGYAENEKDPKPPTLDELTPAQLKVLSLLKEGKPSKEMAELMNVKESTIKAHLTVIYRKLNVRNRTQAVVAAKQLDIDINNTPITLIKDS